MRFVFGEFELDTRHGTLRERGETRLLQPKVFGVLRFLIEQRNRVVTKEDLLDAVWPAEVVNESAAAWSVFHARRALGQHRGTKYPIETLHAQGYRFHADVRILTEDENELASEALRSAARSAPVSRPMVGRADVMRRLDGWLSDLRAGRGRLGWLSGEAGIGKTRCAHALCERAAALGTSTWFGRAIDDLGAPVFWPWLEVLRDAARERPALRPRVQALLARLSASELDPAHVQARDHDAAPVFSVLMDVCELLREASKQAPAIIMIDDLQYADGGSLTLLRLLAADLARYPLLIVTTLREDISAQHAQARLPLMHHADQVTLSRLSAQEVGDYLAQLANCKPSEELIHAVHAVSAGNPLYLEEAVHTLIAEYGSDALSTLSVAKIESILLGGAALRARVQRLPVSTRDTLSVASVLGETFELPMLQELSGLETEALLERLERAQRHALIVPDAPHRYRFAHALIREVLYAEIPLPERVSLHRRAGQLLDTLYGHEARYNEIAHHYYRSLPAGDYASVVEVTCRAARAATRVQAFDDAATLYAWALEAHALDREGTRETRLELLLRRGFSQRYAGHDRDARDTLLLAVDIGIAQKDAGALLRATQVLRPHRSIYSPPDPKVRTALEAALRFASPEHPQQEISARSRLACIPPYAHDLDVSKEQSNLAVKLARSLGDPRALGEALSSQLWAQSGPDDVSTLLSVVDEILALADGPAEVWLDAHAARVGALLTRGDIPAADEAVTAFGQMAHTLRLPEAVWVFDSMRAQRRFLDGDIEAAETTFAELERRGRLLGLSYCNEIAQLHRELSTLVHDGFSTMAVHWNLVDEFTTPDVSFHRRACLVRAACQLKQVEIAKRLLRTFSAKSFSDVPKDVSYLHTLCQVSYAAVALADRECCERLYELLEPYAAFNTVTQALVYDGAVAFFLARLSAALERPETQEHFETALVMNEQIGQIYQLAVTYYAYAGWLDKNKPHAGTRARALRSEAAKLAERTQMHWLSRLTKANAG